MQSGNEFNDWAGSPDGRLVAAADHQARSALVWRRCNRWRHSRVPARAHSVTFSPNGRRLAAGATAGRPVKLWDVETRQEVLTLSGEVRVLAFLNFSADGRTCWQSTMLVCPPLDRAHLGGNCRGEAKDPPSPGHGGREMRRSAAMTRLAKNCGFTRAGDGRKLY